MPDITIQGEVISFPDSAQSPNWSPPLIQFAEAVEDALSGIVGQYDVAPQVYTIASDVNTNVDIPLLSFATSAVRGVYIKYSIYRSSNTTIEAETGMLMLVYNSFAGSWQISREAIGTDTKLTFNVTNGGSVQYTTTAIGGTYASGKLSYSASTLLQA